MRPIPLLLSLGLLSVGCAVAPRSSHETSSASVPSTAASPAEAPPTAASLPFITDDLPGALLEARTRDLPLFIEAWAPW